MRRAPSRSTTSYPDPAHVFGAYVRQAHGPRRARIDIGRTDCRRPMRIGITLNGAGFRRQHVILAVPGGADGKARLRALWGRTGTRDLMNDLAAGRVADGVSVRGGVIRVDEPILADVISTLADAFAIGAERFGRLDRYSELAFTWTILQVLTQGPSCKAARSVFGSSPPHTLPAGAIFSYVHNTYAKLGS